MDVSGKGQSEAPSTIGVDQSPALAIATGIGSVATTVGGIARER
jgi:hypothetical protein